MSLIGNWYTDFGTITDNIEIGRGTTIDIQIRYSSKLRRPCSYAIVSYFANKPEVSEFLNDLIAIGRTTAFDGWFRLLGGLFRVLPAGVRRHIRLRAVPVSQKYYNWVMAYIYVAVKSNGVSAVPLTGGRPVTAPSLDRWLKSGRNSLY